MPEYIIKMIHYNKPYYMLWSTIVDNVTTYDFKDLEEFKEWYVTEYRDRFPIASLPERLERVERFGTSRYGTNVEDMVQYNRSGKNGRRLKFPAFVRKFCKA